MLTKITRKIKSFLGNNPAMSPIKEQLASFDEPAFRKKVNLIDDNFVRDHALNILEDGFTVIPNSVDEKLVDSAVDSFLEWKDRNKHEFLPDFYKYADKLDRIVSIHSILPEFRALFHCNRALLIQDFLFQEPTTLYTTLFFEVGSAQSIHRDIPLFWTKPASMYFGSWVALEKTDQENGPLIVIPGSHRLPLFDRDAIARSRYQDLSQIMDMDNDLWGQYQDKLIFNCEEYGLTIREVHVGKGETIIWHPLLAHGGAQIADPGRTRMSFVMHTTPKNVPVFHTDVFFNVNRSVPDKAPWAYYEENGRAMMQTNKLALGHAHPDYDYSKLT